MARVLVTGGNGNIGAYAAAHFMRLGHHVIVLDRGPQSTLLGEVAPDVEVVTGDILDDDNLSDVVRSHRIDLILHLAAFLGPESLEFPIKALDVNCRGTANIFDVAIKHGVSRVCWASSIGAIGIMPDYNGRLVDETYRVAPTTPYGATKYYGELMTPIYRARGLDIVCVRPVFAFGLGKLTGSWGANYNRIIYNAALGIPSTFPGWSSNGLQIIYNKDQAKLCVEATLAGPADDWLFNTPTEQVFSEGQFAELIREAVPGAVIEMGGSPPAGSAFPPNVDGARAVKQLGFKRGYTVLEGVKEMVDYYRRNPNQQLA